MVGRSRRQPKRQQTGALRERGAAVPSRSNVRTFRHVSGFHTAGDESHCCGVLPDGHRHPRPAGFRNPRIAQGVSFCSRL